MKKVSTITLGVLAAGLAFSNYPASAQSETPQAISKQASEEKNEQTTNYIAFSGMISEIKQNGESLSLVVEESENFTQMIFPITDDVLLFNNGSTALKKDNLKKGLKVVAYYDRNKPMPLIYPATIIPAIVVVHDEKEMEQVKVSKFDKNLLSLDGELRLRLDKETVLMNEKGDKVKEEELYGRELIVFYTISTKSIPAQTAPEKVIVLNSTNDQNVQQLINEDHYMKNGAKMIPLRKIAEFLGYDVQWEQKTTGIMMRLQNRSFQVSIGKVEYGYNRSVRKFDVAPEVNNGKTYVSEDFLKMLILN